VIDIENTDTFVRTIYAGNAVTRVQSMDSLKIITIRGSAFTASSDTGGNALIESGMVSCAYGIITHDTIIWKQLVSHQ